MRLRILLAFLAGLLCAASLWVPIPALGSANNDAACAALNFSSSLTPVSKASVPPNVCASVWAANVPEARGLLSLPGDGGLLVVQRPANGGSTGLVVWLNDTDQSGSIDQTAERATIATAAGINHGLALWRPDSCGGASGGPTCAFLLASSINAVYLWPFDLSSPSDTLGAPTTFVSGLPSSGHNTRTLEVDPAGAWLYVSVGSDGNIDTSTSRSLIWRFNLTDWAEGTTFAYGTDGELFAGGLRNEVALAWDSHGVLWGAENGADNLNRADLGGDVHNNNPGEEINKFSQAAGAFFGYPYCFSEYNLPAPHGQGKGTQWAWPQFMNDGTHNDNWCRDTSNVVPPAAVMPAHTAPLGMKFVTLSSDSTSPFAFPPQPDGAAEQTYLVVAQHGSWNRNPAQGYRVVRFPTRDDGESDGVSLTSQEEEPIFQFDDEVAQMGSGWGRPVDVAIGSRGELFVSDDELGRIVVLRYARDVNQTAEPLSPPSAAPIAAGSSWMMGLLAAGALFAILKQ